MTLNYGVDVFRHQSICNGEQNVMSCFEHVHWFMTTNVYHAVYYISVGSHGMGGSNSDTFNHANEAENILQNSVQKA